MMSHTSKKVKNHCFRAICSNSVVYPCDNFTKSFIYPRFYFFLLTVIVFLFSNLCLVNTKDVLTRPESMELAFFQNLMMRYIEMAKDTLLKK